MLKLGSLIALPEPVLALWQAQQRLRAHYASTGLTFTFDGKLLGDIAEALVSDAFGVKLCTKRIGGVDGHASDGRSVQIKCTGKLNGGPAFTPGEGIADHLLFLTIDFAGGATSIEYNGPEAPVRRLLPTRWNGTKVVSRSRVIALDSKVEPSHRLLML